MESKKFCAHIATQSMSDTGSSATATPCCCRLSAEFACAFVSVVSTLSHERFDSTARSGQRAFDGPLSAHHGLRLLEERKGGSTRGFPRRFPEATIQRRL